MECVVGNLVFKCPATGEKFDTGFLSTRAEMQKMPRDAQMILRCPVCRNRHTFMVVDGEITGQD
jgi:hypothetical protein